MSNSAQINVERPHAPPPFCSADELRGLQWDTRYSIIKGICDGLQYLHVEKHIIHMDLKPENILLDESMVPKIADFGISRVFGQEQTRLYTQTVVGS